MSHEYTKVKNFASPIFTQKIDIKSQSCPLFGGGGYQIPFLLAEMISQDRVRWPEWKYDVNTGCFPALAQTAQKVCLRLKTQIWIPGNTWVLFKVWKAVLSMDVEWCRQGCVRFRVEGGLPRGICDW